MWRNKLSLRVNARNFKARVRLHDNLGGLLVALSLGLLRQLWFFFYNWKVQWGEKLKVSTSPFIVCPLVGMRCWGNSVVLDTMICRFDSCRPNRKYDPRETLGMIWDSEMAWHRQSET